MTKEELIERIKKLLALSDSSNPNEAAIALSRAQKLMEQYHIDINDVSEEIIGELEADSIAGVKAKVDMRHIGSILQKVLGVSVIMRSRGSTVDSLLFIGPKELLDTCEYIFVILCISYKAAKARYKESDLYVDIYKTLRDADGFILGREFQVQTIFETIQAREESMTTTPHGIALLKSLLSSCAMWDETFDYWYKKLQRDFVKSFSQGYFNSIYSKVAEFVQDKEIEQAIEDYQNQKHTGVKMSKSRHTKIYGNAYSAGKDAGDEVNLMNAVKGTAAERKMLK